MDPILNIVVSILMLVIGLLALLIMLNVQGNPKHQEYPKFLSLLHRILGYIFLVLLIFMLVTMTGKLSGPSFKASPVNALHMLLAWLVLPLLVIKILIARFFIKLYSTLISYGILIFLLAFALVLITTLPHLLHASAKPVLQHSTPPPDSIELLPEDNQENFNGPVLLKQKCTLCHNLERVVKATKVTKDWETTIRRMIQHSKKSDFLTPRQIHLLSLHLAKQ